MARIIKRPQSSTDSDFPPLISVMRFNDGTRIIDKSIYEARLMAKTILNDGEQARTDELAAAELLAQHIKERAMSQAATEALDSACERVFKIFRERARHIDDNRDDIHLLAIEIVQKILGGPLRISRNSQDEIVAEAIERLRAKRKLTLKCPTGTLSKVNSNHTRLFQRLKMEPEMVLEEGLEVEQGTLKIVTDAGVFSCRDSVVDTVIEQILHE